MTLKMNYQAYLNKLDFNTKITNKSKDQGADLILLKDEIKTVVQAKRYKGSVGNKTIQEVVASKDYYDADNTMIITSGYYTKSAIDLANKNNVKVIDRNELIKLLNKT